MDEERVPLETLKEGESHSPLFDDTFADNVLIDDLTTADSLNKNERPRDISVSSGNDVPIIGAVRRGSSISLFFHEIKESDLDLRGTDRHQRNAFHYAVTKPGILKTLLERFKTDPVLKLALLQEDKDGQTAIHRAAFVGNAKSLEILYEYDNALITLRSNFSKCSVLHFAVKGSSTATVQFVLNKDPGQTNMTDNMSRTPVHYAATLKRKDIIALLISKGTDLMKKDTKGQLAIHIAASKGLLNIIKLLIKDDPGCIDCIDNTKQTPLILAAKNGCFQVVLYLLSEQAEYRLIDDLGFSAFDWAVKNTKSEVVEVFLNKDYWKEIILTSQHGPEKCLALLVESMPETSSLLLLDKCITIKGTIKQPESYQVKYDFFCLESRDEDSCAFEALNSMVENKREKCLCHPLCIKFVNVKWRKRGFKFHLASVLMALLFHICLMIFTTNIRGVITTRIERISSGGRNLTKSIPKRNGTRPDRDFMMALRIIMLFIVCVTMLKEVYQAMKQRFQYFFHMNHYIQWALCISVLMFLLPVNKKITKRQLGSGAVSILLSWSTLIQFLKMVPVLGVYILAIEKVFWTLMKIFIVVFIFLLSFSSTFYVLLGEYESYQTFGLSIVSTFVAMVSGPNYEQHFVEKGTLNPELYGLKLTILFFFIIIMSVVVNNTLVGLAVGDTDQVLKSAKHGKFLNKVLFTIHLEHSMNGLPGFHMMKDESVIEFPGRKKSSYEMILDFVYFGGSDDKLEGLCETSMKIDENDGEITLEDHIEKLLATKIENLHSTLRLELADMFEKSENKRKVDIEKIIEKLS